VSSTSSIYRLSKEIEANPSLTSPPAPSPAILTHPFLGLPQVLIPDNDSQAPFKLAKRGGGTQTMADVSAKQRHRLPDALRPKRETKAKTDDAFVYSSAEVSAEEVSEFEPMDLSEFDDEKGSSSGAQEKALEKEREKRKKARNRRRNLQKREKKTMQQKMALEGHSPVVSPLSSAKTAIHPTPEELEKRRNVVTKRKARKERKNQERDENRAAWAEKKKKKEEGRIARRKAEDDEKKRLKQAERRKERKKMGLEEQKDHPDRKRKGGKKNERWPANRKAKSQGKGAPYTSRKARGDEANAAKRTEGRSRLQTYTSGEGHYSAKEASHQA